MINIQYCFMNYLIPEQLETERLVMRIFQEADREDLHAYYSDPECVKYTTGKPFTEYETWQKIASLIGHWHIRLYGPYVIEEKYSGTIMGFAGPYYPPVWPDPEIQWSLIKRFWGKGYASEAARAVKRMLLENLLQLSFISIIHPANTDSIHLAEKLHTAFEKDFYFMDTNWHIYRHL